MHSGEGAPLSAVGLYRMDVTSNVALDMCRICMKLYLYTKR